MTRLSFTAAALALAAATLAGPAQAQLATPEQAPAQKDEITPKIVLAVILDVNAKDQGLAVVEPQLIQHASHSAVVAQVHQNGLTTKVRQGSLVARYRLEGDTADRESRARCDARRWRETCTVALDGGAPLAPGRITVRFADRS